MRFGALIFGSTLLIAAGAAHARNPATRPAATQPAAAATAVPARSGAFDRERIQRSSLPADTAPTTQAASRSDVPPASVFDARRVLLAVGLVVGLIVVMRLALRKMFPAAAAGRASGAVRVLARVPLSPKQQVLLLQVGRRVIVVGDSGTPMRALAQIDDADEVATLLGQLESERATPLKPFGSFFGRARDQFGAQPDAPGPESDEKDEPDSSEPAAPADLGLAAAQGELRGLMDKVRGLAQQLKR